ncbi:MAG TPA: fused MFS/spermidine synthase, partial [Planctomycetota bacterium]|nr:fused MFS/spermidine synthase [Planctomycetota bacterium]
MTEGRRGPRTAFAALLLVPSGAAALAHEAVWARLWTPYAGAGVATSSAVVAGALLGLAAGAALGGRLTERVRRPARLFVAAEAIGAVLCLLVLPLAAILRAADASGAFSPGLPTRLLLVAGACAVPCLPLGASLPALVRAVVVRPGTAGALLRWLYAANTVGAVAGVLLATGWGFEMLGLSGTVRAAVAAQALVAVGGLWLDAVSPGPNSLPSVAPASARALRVSGLEVAAFLSGAAGLAVQVAWIRRLTPALGTTSYAFGTVLAAYLLAVAL